MLSTNILFPFVLSGPSLSTVVSTIQVTVPAQALMDLVIMPVEVANSSEVFIATWTCRLRRWAGSGWM
jgi:hypothetical protein